MPTGVRPDGAKQEKQVQPSIVKRKDPQHEAYVEVFEVMRGHLANKEDHRDKKTGEYKEQINCRFTRTLRLLARGYYR
jgi:hypothetical protein